MNPLTELTGPQFMGFYLRLAGAVLTIGWWLRRLSDQPSSNKPTLVPEKVDPYEIAYLRGGENELTRVVIINLTERGYLRVAKKESKTLWGLQIQKEELRIEQAKETVPLDKGHELHRLSNLEQTVFSWFNLPKTAEQIFRTQDLPATLRVHSLNYMEQLYQSGFLEIEEAKAVGWKIGAVAGLVLGGIGTARILTAHSSDQPVMFLVFMMVITSLFLIGICGAKRLSRRGKDYLQSILSELDETRIRNSGNLTLVAVGFGVAALASSPLSDLEQLFQRGSKSNGASTWWAGCGGGGCGGCGGCG